MKTQTFHMRMSETTKANLERLKRHYNLSASAVIDMLISKETREMGEDEKGNT